MAKFNMTTVILGADVAAYAYARDLYSEYRIKPYVFTKIDKGSITSSKIIHRIMIENNESEYLLKTLLKFSKSHKGKKMILACGDNYAKFLIENKKALSKDFIIPYIDKKIYDKVIEKDKFYKYCEKYKMNYPKAIEYSLNDKKDLNLPFDFPVVFKPADSVMYHATTFPGKKKAYVLNTLEELKHTIELVRKSTYNKKMIIQDFIPGTDDNMRVLTCYCDKNSDVVFASLGRPILEEHAPGAIGNYAAIINDYNEEIVKQASFFLKKIKYTGFANFDLKYDNRDNKYKFFELNVRLGQSNFYINGSGYNPIKFIFDDLVFNKKFPKLIVANKEFLYTIVPKYILMKYIKDKEILNTVNRLYKEKKVLNPISYNKDMSLARYSYIQLTLIKQIIKFYKYF